MSQTVSVDAVKYDYKGVCDDADERLASKGTRD